MASSLLRLLLQKNAFQALRALGHQALTFSLPSSPTLGRYLNLLSLFTSLK